MSYCYLHLPEGFFGGHFKPPYIVILRANMVKPTIKKTLKLYGIEIKSGEFRAIDDLSRDIHQSWQGVHQSRYDNRFYLVCNQSVAVVSIEQDLKTSKKVRRAREAVLARDSSAPSVLSPEIDPEAESGSEEVVDFQAVLGAKVEALVTKFRMDLVYRFREFIGIRDVIVEIEEHDERTLLLYTRYSNTFVVKID